MGGMGACVVAPLAVNVACNGELLCLNLGGPLGNCVMLVPFAVYAALQGGGWHR